jgi:WD40 repeat protein
MGTMVMLQTLEGHDSSVLRAEFISQGMQLVTAGADGLLKLWNIKTSECTATFDDHDGRIWALTGLYLMTGVCLTLSVRAEYIYSAASQATSPAPFKYLFNKYPY